MAGRTNSTALIRLLEQLTPVQRALCDERVVVLPAEAPCTVQGAGDAANSLELAPTIADAFFINSKCLCEEFVADFLEAGLVGDLAGGEEKAEGEFGDRGRRAT